MSAGTKCSLTIKFTPLVNKDIFDYLRIKCYTGNVEIPI